jgi:hypothetical protein
MIHILKIPRHCKYCGSDMTATVSATSYAENPFCNDCLDERVSRAPRAPENEKAVLVGRYFHFTQDEKKVG